MGFAFAQPILQPLPMSQSLRTPGGMRDRDSAWQRCRERKYREVGFANQRVGEQFVILPALHLGGPEGLEVLGDELGVEQLESPRPQPRHQMHQRNFRGVAGAMEHALAEEGAAEAHPVKPADQDLPVIDLDGVAMADVVELAIKRADAPIDPGPRTARSRLGAAVDDGLEIAVANDGERLRPNGAAKSRRN